MVLAVIAARTTILILLLAVSTSRAGAREFRFSRDTFAFANDTAFAYGIDEQGRLHISRRDTPPDFSHGCFLLARGALQFHKFARFTPEQPRVSREEYRRIVRRIFRIPVWCRAPARPIVVPGFRDLRSFSIAYEGLLKENLGNWVMTYLRPGNWRLITGHLRAGQHAAARWLVKSVDRNEPRALYLSRFPKMNHVVVVYDFERRPNGNIRFHAYDPNYPNERAWLDYREAERSFEFQKRWYFPGGRVNVMRVFISPIH